MVITVYNKMCQADSLKGMDFGYIQAHFPTLTLCSAHKFLYILKKGLNVDIPWTAEKSTSIDLGAYFQPSIMYG